MKLLIVGAGIIGTIYGWALAGGGHDVTHLVRPGKAKRYKDGIRMDVIDNRKGHKKAFKGLYSLKVTETVSEADGYELVIIPTKPYQMLAALNQIVPLIGPVDFLLLTQNWYGTADVDAILPRSRYLYGDAKAGGAFIDGVLISTIFESIDIGQIAGAQGDSAQGQALKNTVALFESIAIKAIQHKNILEYIWVQYAINAGLWPPVVRAGSLEGVLKNWKMGDQGVRAVKECLDVVASRGVDLKEYPETKMYSNSSPVSRFAAMVMIRLLFRFNKSVMRSSLHALGDPREIRTSFYDLLEAGREKGIAMPVMSAFETDIKQFAGGEA